MLSQHEHITALDMDNMNFDSIKNKVDKLSYIEQHFNVGDWQWYGIDYWPVLKNVVYFRDRKIGNNLVKNLINSPGRIASKVLLKLKTKVTRSFAQNLSNTKIYQSDVLFSGALQHRIDFGNKSLNRYFDPLMDSLEDQFKVQLFEYSPLQNNNANLYKSHRLGSPFAVYNSVVSKLPQDLELDHTLTENVSLVAKAFNLSPDLLLKEFVACVKRILAWKATWEEILNQSQSKVVMLLCYYNEPMYGLVLASRKFNIPTVDMQHGGQGVLHPSYYFENFPAQGYNTLPDYFWTWEPTSKDQIDRFLQKNKRHQAIMGGNPWIDYLATREVDTDSNTSKKKIVCTLTIGLESILPTYLLEAIKQADHNYIWYLRLHPRTSAFDRKMLMKIISDAKIEGKVNTTDANVQPLPYLLNGAWAHISHSSGSIAEAAIMKVPRNVITNSIGRDNYKSLISEGSASYFNVENEVSLFDFLINLEPHVFQSKGTTSIGEEYKQIANSIINARQVGNIKQFES